MTHFKQLHLCQLFLFSRRLPLPADYRRLPLCEHKKSTGSAALVRLRPRTDYQPGKDGRGSGGTDDDVPRGFGQHPFRPARRLCAEEGEAAERVWHRGEAGRGHPVGGGAAQGAGGEARAGGQRRGRSPGRSPAEGQPVDPGQAGAAPGLGLEFASGPPARSRRRRVSSSSSRRWRRRRRDRPAPQPPDAYRVRQEEL